MSLNLWVDEKSVRRLITNSKHCITILWRLEGFKSKSDVINHFIQIRHSRRYLDASNIQYFQKECLKSSRVVIKRKFGNYMSKFINSECTAVYFQNHGQKCKKWEDYSFLAGALKYMFVNHLYIHISLLIRGKLKIHDSLCIFQV